MYAHGCDYELHSKRDSSNESGGELHNTRLNVGWKGAPMNLVNTSTRILRVYLLKVSPHYRLVIESAFMHSPHMFNEIKFTQPGKVKFDLSSGLLFASRDIF